MASGLLLAVAVSVPVRTWGVHGLQRLGLSNGWSEALFYGVGGWDRWFSARWALLALVLLVVVTRSQDVFRRDLFWGAAAAIVALRVLVFAADPQRLAPAPWWALPFMVPLLCLALAAVAAAVRARAEALLLAAPMVLHLTWPHPSPEVRFGWVPLSDGPPPPVAVIAVVAVTLAWLVLAPGRAERFARAVALTAVSVLVADVLIVLAVAAWAPSSMWATTVVNELRQFGLLVTLLILLGSAAAGVTGRTTGQAPTAPTEAAEENADFEARL